MSETMIFLHSYRTSFHLWKRKGILGRELLVVYDMLDSSEITRVLFLSYDYRDEAILNDSIFNDEIFRERIEVLTPSRALGTVGSVLYSIYSPVFHRNKLSGSDFVYTNQASGSWVALIVKILYRKKIVYRYGHSLWRRHRHYKQWFRLVFSSILEIIMRAGSDAVIVPTEMDVNFCGLKFNSNINVIPNYVDTNESSSAVSFVKKEDKAVFLGRLERVKNVEAIVEACDRLGLDLDIYGAGTLDGELRELSTKKSIKIDVKGKIDSGSVLSTLERYKYYFLVSQHEGMPKTLIEAMSSGCVCIVGPQLSMAGVVSDGESGFVCPKITSDSIVKTFKRATESDLLNVSDRAREIAQKKYSRARIHSMRIEVLRSCVYSI